MRVCPFTRDPFHGSYVTEKTRPYLKVYLDGVVILDVPLTRIVFRLFGGIATLRQSGRHF